MADTDTTFATIAFQDVVSNLEKRFELPTDCCVTVYDALMEAYMRGREDGISSVLDMGEPKRVGGGDKVR